MRALPFIRQRSKAEGAVLRARARRTIAKACFADYAKALDPKPEKKRR